MMPLLLSVLNTSILMKLAITNDKYIFILVLSCLEEKGKLEVWLHKAILTRNYLRVYCFYVPHNDVSPIF